MVAMGVFMAESRAQPNAEPIAAERKTSRRQIRVVIITVVVIAILLLVPPLAGTWGLAYHWGCERGDLVTVIHLWTPVVLVNAPYNGTAYAAGVLMSGGEPIGGGGGSIEASNGSSEGLFALGEWLIYSTSRQLQSGPGASASCSGSLAPVLAPVLGTVLPAGATVTPVQLGGPGSTVTQGVQTNFTLRGYPSVEWEMNYDPSNQPKANLTACPGGSARVLPIANRINVTVPFQNGSLRAVLSSEQVFIYALLPPGNWLVQASPSGTWAFDYHPPSC
jgi:hypothetical protein